MNANHIKKVHTKTTPTIAVNTTRDGNHLRRITKWLPL